MAEGEVQEEMGENVGLIQESACEKTHGELVVDEGEGGNQGPNTSGFILYSESHGSTFYFT